MQWLLFCIKKNNLKLFSMLDNRFRPSDDKPEKNKRTQLVLHLCSYVTDSKILMVILFLFVYFFIVFMVVDKCENVWGK